MNNLFLASFLERLISVFGFLFIIASLNPFFGFPQFDSQPFSTLFAFSFLFLLLIAGKFFRPQKELIYSLCFIVAGCFIGILTDNHLNLMSLRAIAGYCSIFLYYLAYDHYLRHFGFPLKIFQFFVLAWILVGILQLIEPSIVSNFVAQRTSIGRGISSLSPEPTHFGIFLFFSSWLILIFKNYKADKANLLILLSALLSVLFLAKSSMTFLFIVIAFFFYCAYLFIRKRYMQLFLINYIFILLCMLSIVFISPDNRIFYIILKILSEGFYLFHSDESAFSRLSDIIFPFIGLIENHLLPGGFTSFGKKFYMFYDLMFWPTYQDGKKIMSWTMSMWYELGFFGLIAWLYLLKLSLIKASTRSILETFFLFLLLFSAIPALFPLPIMVMVLLRSRNKILLTPKA